MCEKFLIKQYLFSACSSRFIMLSLRETIHWILSTRWQQLFRLPFSWLSFLDFFFTLINVCKLAADLKICIGQIIRNLFIKLLSPLDDCNCHLLSFVWLCLLLKRRHSLKRGFQLHLRGNLFMLGHEFSEWITPSCTWRSVILSSFCCMFFMTAKTFFSASSFSSRKAATSLGRLMLLDNE